jgi:hypothetical protein
MPRSLRNGIALPNRRTPPKNLGLLELIRAKHEWNRKPSVKELKKGFRGWHQRGYLPHFDAPGVTQFVTFQLHDSLPVTRRAEFEALLKEPDYFVKRRKLKISSMVKPARRACRMKKMRSALGTLSLRLMTSRGRTSRSP